MAVDSKHPQYEKRVDEWETCRDCYDGIRAIRARGEKYLPRLSRWQSNTDYSAFLKRAVYFPAYPRTIEALVGAVMRKPPTVEAPPRVLRDLKDTDGFGTTVQQIIGQVVRELLIGSRMEIAQDVTGTAPGEVTRCLWSLYHPEDLLMWLFAVQGGRPRLTRAVLLHEDFVQDEATGEVNERRIYRVLTRDGDGRTILRRFAPATDGKLQEIGNAQPLLTPAGQSLSRLPVHIADLPTTARVPFTPPKPVLVDMADMSLSHYRTSAALEHGANYVALPTPYVATDSEAPRPDEPLRVGGGTVWWLPKGSRADYMEVSGQAFNALETMMGRKARQIMATGARTVAEPVRHAETALAAQIKDNQDHTLMSMVCDTAEHAVEQAINLHMEWLGYPGDAAKVSINRDWVNSRLSPQHVMTLCTLLEKEKITADQFATALEHGEWLPPSEEGE